MAFKDNFIIVIIINYFIEFLLALVLVKRANRLLITRIYYIIKLFFIFCFCLLVINLTI